MDYPITVLLRSANASGPGDGLTYTLSTQQKNPATGYVNYPPDLVGFPQSFTNTGPQQFACTFNVTSLAAQIITLYYTATDPNSPPNQQGGPNKYLEFSGEVYPVGSTGPQDTGPGVAYPNPTSGSFTASLSLVDSKSGVGETGFTLGQRPQWNSVAKDLPLTLPTPPPQGISGGSNYTNVDECFTYNATSYEATGYTGQTNTNAYAQYQSDIRVIGVRSPLNTQPVPSCTGNVTILVGGKDLKILCDPPGLGFYPMNDSSGNALPPVWMGLPTAAADWGARLDISAGEVDDGNYPYIDRAANPPSYFDNYPNSVPGLSEVLAWRQANPPQPMQRQGTGQWFYAPPSPVPADFDGVGPWGMAFSLYGGLGTSGSRNSLMNYQALPMTGEQQHGSPENYIVATGAFGLARFPGYPVRHLAFGDAPYGTAESLIQSVSKHYRALPVIKPGGMPQTNLLLNTSEFIADTVTLTAPPGEGDFDQNVNVAAMGDATFNFDHFCEAYFWPEVTDGTLDEAPLDGQLPPMFAGAQIEIRAEFADGTHFTLLSGTADDTGYIAPQTVDYWMGHGADPMPQFATQMKHPVTGNIVQFDGAHHPHWIVTFPNVSQQAADPFSETSPPATITVNYGGTVDSVFGLLDAPAQSDPRVTFGLRSPFPFGSGQGLFAYGFNPKVLHPATVGVYPPQTQGNWTCAYAFTRKTLFLGFLLDAIIGPPPAPTGVASACLALDASRRPLAATAGPQTAALGFSSNDAGHTFRKSTIDAAATCSDISLLVDTHVSRFCAVYSKGPAGSSQLYSASGPITDTFTPDVPPAPIAGISGSFPACAQHPQNRSLSLMAYASGGKLLAATSGDGGKTWQPGGTIANGVDFSKSGRPALSFLGEVAFAAYASGSGAACAKSADWGQTWAAAGAAVPDGPYSALSLLGFRGTLYLLAFTGAAGSALKAALLVSGDLGVTWKNADGTLPNIAPPSAIGVIPQTGQLRLGMSHHSDNAGSAWTAD